MGAAIVWVGGGVFATIGFALKAGLSLGAFVLAFARALGDFGVTIMIAGNIPGETRTMTEFIARLRHDLGLTILLIEHDMSLVSAVSDRQARSAFERAVACEERDCGMKWPACQSGCPWASSGAACRA